MNINDMDIINDDCDYNCVSCNEECEDALTCNNCGCIISEDECEAYGGYCSGC